MRVVTSARKVAVRNGEKDPVPANLKRKVKESFVDTLCFLFDGILNAAMATGDTSMVQRPTRISSSRVVTVKDIVRSPIQG